MRCDNCQGEYEPAFTLLAHPSGGEAVVVDFCCIGCLQAWTSTFDADLERWDWGVDDDALGDVVPAGR